MDPLELGAVPIVGESVKQPRGQRREGQFVVKTPTLDPLDVLDSLAQSCTRAEDGAFWILTSAAAYLAGFGGKDDQASTADVFYWRHIESKRRGPMKTASATGSASCATRQGWTRQTR